MSFPTLTSATVSGVTSGTSTTVNYPASGINSGDLLICIWSNDGGIDLPTWPAGDWADNELYQQNSTHGSSVSWIIADGTENGGSFAVTHPNEGTTATLLHFENWHGTTPPEVSTRGSGGGDDWRAHSLNPSWASETDDTTWLAVLTYDNSTRTIDGYPSGFTGNQSNDRSSPSTARSGIGRCTKEEKIATQSQPIALAIISADTGHIDCLVGIRGGVVGGAANPKGVLGMPLHGPFGGPI